MISELFAAFRLFFKKFQRIFITPVYLFWRNLLRKINPQNIVSKIAVDVKDGVKGITAKPNNIRQYVVIGDRFFAKKLLLFLFILLIAVIILMIKFVNPWIVSMYFTKSMWINSAEAINYSGKVRLYDTPEFNKLIFEGRLDNGMVEGEGTLYDYDSALVYEGDFAAGQYSGQGKPSCRWSQICRGVDVSRSHPRTT